MPTGCGQPGPPEPAHPPSSGASAEAAAATRLRRAALAVASSQHASTPSSEISTISCQPSPKGLCDLAVLPAEVEVDEGRVIGVQRRQEAGAPQLREDVVLEPRERVGDEDVRGRAHRERDPVRGHTTHQPGVVHDREAVVDPLDPQLVDAGGDGGGRRVLALMGGQPEPGGARRLVRRSVRHRIDAQLGRVHADADDAFDPAGRGPSKLCEPLHQLQPRCRSESAVHVRDGQAGGSGLRLCCGETLVEPGNDVREFLACCEMTGRREERLAMTTLCSALSTTLSGSSTFGSASNEAASPLIAVIMPPQNPLHGGAKWNRTPTARQRAGP